MATIVTNCTGQSVGLYSVFWSFDVNERSPNDRRPINPAMLRLTQSNPEIFGLKNELGLHS